jgi:hypothetical protein
MRALLYVALDKSLLKGIYYYVAHLPVIHLITLGMTVLTLH